MATGSKIAEDFKRGNEKETLFAKIAKKRGYTVVEASRMANAIEHWDFILKTKFEQFKIEVKSLKRFDEHDTDFMEGHTWICTHGKGENSKGWLYGKAEVFAFETPNSFIIVPAGPLRELVEQKIAGQEEITIKTNIEDMTYKKWINPKEGKYDVLVLVPLVHIKQIRTDEWLK